MNTCEHLINGMCALTGRTFNGNLPSKIGKLPREGSLWVTKDCSVGFDKKMQAECDKFEPLNTKLWEEREHSFIIWLKENGGWVVDNSNPIDDPDL